MAFKEGFDSTHEPSAKELERGIDVAPMMEGKLQFGKLFNCGNNLTELRKEWKGRYAAQVKRGLI